MHFICVAVVVEAMCIASLWILAQLLALIRHGVVGKFAFRQVDCCTPYRQVFAFNHF